MYLDAESAQKDVHLDAESAQKDVHLEVERSRKYTKIREQVGKKKRDDESIEIFSTSVKCCAAAGRANKNLHEQDNINKYHNGVRLTPSPNFAGTPPSSSAIAINKLHSRNAQYDVQ